MNLSFAWAGDEPSLVCSRRRRPAAASADGNSIMALFGSLWSCCCCCCCLYLGLLLDHSLADDGAAAKSVTAKDPVGACMWPWPESAVMSCDSDSVVLITETYMTRLVGRLDKCAALHAAFKPDYPSCRVPIPTDLVQLLSDNCNNTQQCTLGGFIKGATVVAPSTACGNGTDTAVERNFLVIKWGCVDKTFETLTPPPEATTGLPLKTSRLVPYTGVDPATHKLTKSLVNAFVDALWVRNEGRSIYVGREALQQCLLSLALLVVVVLQF